MTCGAIELDPAFGCLEIINKSANSMPQDLATAFSEVNSGLLGATYVPIWIVGRQLVNGWNYYLICDQVRSTRDSKTSVVNMVINIPPAQNDGTTLPAKIVEIIDEADLSEDLRVIFESTTKLLMGASYKPLAYVGKQVVHGMNYYFICEARGIYPNAVPYAVMMCINDMNGTSSIVSITPITKEETTPTSFLGKPLGEWP